MLKSHEKFHSANGKRLVLVADDEAINREMLGMVLSADYELLYAEDGEQALALIRENRDTLSLVLLDLMMPGLSGREVLRRIKADPDIARIPVIVLTADQDAEIESLGLGATDFIPKPYPRAGVILARVRRTIELSEDRQIIQSTERDPLTGLYNREYFYRYAEQFDQHHKDMPMDAMVVDVNHFHMINERFGTAYGDRVLRRIGEHVREVVRDTGGIVCRREADTFMIYCPHGKDYKAILENGALALAEDDAASSRIRLRMGVYADVDKSMDIERRFDRAKMAADTVRNSFTKNIGIYDSTLHERELYAEQLIEDFHTAIREKQFKLYYQPKFDVRPETPVLASAEALVRWQHPRLGLISPGVFIPLFEDNGLIQTLDSYVWRTAAAQIREWKERLGFAVPVSVNVSRIDMYDPHLVDRLGNLVRVNGLEPHELLLEITESAYTQDSDQIIGTVNQLRELGFCIEMDDFGTGYSSLNMISTLPIDALKLDMQFIRNAFNQRRDTRMLEVIIDIADYLGVPVIAEGVETEEQLNALRTMGCDMVQGYYFSRPVPAEEYERFIDERKKQMAPPQLPHAARENPERSIGKIAYALSCGFESVYYVDTETGSYVQFSSDGRYEDLQIEHSGDDFFGELQRNIPRMVYEEDQARVAQCLQRDALLTRMAEGHPFLLTCRLLVDGRPVYHSLKVVRAGSQDENHIVIGVSDVDDPLRQTAALAQNNVDFGSLARTLTSDMESIYYVDMVTDNYMEFITDRACGALRLEISGEDFFADCRRNIAGGVYKDDQQRVLAALSKQSLAQSLSRHQSFTMDYRLMIDGQPLYYRLKAIPAEQTGSRHIIIGVSNIDGQAVLEQHNHTTYAKIAQALARDYFSIYYVNIENDRFIEYSANGDFCDLGIEKSGEDFFNLSRHNMERVAHPEDLPRFFAAFTKENVLRELSEHGVFAIGYRLMFGGVPNYVRMKATLMGDKYIVIGVSNVNAEMKRQQENLTYSSIARALAADYFSIYYVDMETDRFIEYSAHENARGFEIETEGEDFFNFFRQNIRQTCCTDDVEDFLTAFTKENLLKAKATTGVFTLSYRMMFDGVPTYVHMKATCMEDKDDPHIVIGVSNIDEQMRREQEQATALHTAREMVNRDSLTGVKSKHAYVETERAINEAIASAAAEPFAMVICDVNGLKAVNDTQGHAAGDELIRSASREICNIFTHSPVFRYGGDEFVVILRGRDYADRVSLARRLAAENQAHSQFGGAVIACGVAEFDAGQDENVEAVFLRADAAMYENKKVLKQTDAVRQ